MKSDKKGLSDVVTSVLLILLVLAAVVILWGFLSGFITGAGRGITTVCMTLDIQPVSCKITDTGVDVTYKWVSGDVNLTGVNLILASTNGNSRVDEGEVINRLATKVMTITDFADPASFNVAGVALSESGNPTPCPEYKTPVACTD